MKTYFNKKSKEFNFKTVQLLQKHDLYFGTPEYGPTFGIPLGDGSTGGLVWITEDEIHINVTNTDLYYKNPNTEGCVIENLTEDQYTNKHVGEIVVKFDCPCFDKMYLDSFKEVLSLSDATLRIKSKTPFSQVDVKSFINSRRGIGVLRVRSEFELYNNMKIYLKRWGSRSFARWYTEANDNTKCGLADSRCIDDGRRMYITQRFGNEFLCFGAEIDNNYYHSDRVNEHVGLFENRRAKHDIVNLFYKVIIAPSETIAQDLCKRALDDAEGLGSDLVYQDHEFLWNKFWNKSYIKTNCNHDYLENLYYLNLYYANSSCRGKYPTRVLGTLWNFNKDYNPWNYFFHFNQMHLYNSLYASGNAELTLNYFKLKKEQLPKAIEYARTIKGKKGAFYHDVMDINGKASMNDSYNTTPGAQLALMMNEYYHYTKDKIFREEILIPVITSVGDYYISCLEFIDGKYHISNTTCYEGNVIVKDSLTDLVTMRILFKTLFKLTNVGKYKEILDNLVDFTYLNVDGHKILSIGKDEKGNDIRRTYEDAKLTNEIYNFPEIELSPLYPFTNYQQLDYSSDLYQALNYTANLLKNTNKYNFMQFSMMPIFLERLGSEKEYLKYCEDLLNKYQVFPNGFNADSPVGLTDLDSYSYLNNVHNVNTKMNYLDNGSNFKHFNLETLPIISKAFEETVLSSFDNQILIGKFLKPNETLLFDLESRNGFIIHCHLHKTNMFMRVESKTGKDTLIILPEHINVDNAYIYDEDLNLINDSKSVIFNRNTITIKEFPKHSIVYISIDPLEELEEIFMSKNLLNMEYKTFGKARLGSPNQYNNN